MDWDARGVTAVVVGSGALLGGWADRNRALEKDAAFSPTCLTKTSLPIRVFDEPKIIAGVERCTQVAPNVGVLAFLRTKPRRELRIRSGSTQRQR